MNFNIFLLFLFLSLCSGLCVQLCKIWLMIVWFIYFPIIPGPRSIRPMLKTKPIFLHSKIPKTVKTTMTTMTTMKKTQTKLTKRKKARNRPKKKKTNQRKNIKSQKRNPKSLETRTTKKTTTTNQRHLTNYVSKKLVLLEWNF